MSIMEAICIALGSWALGLFTATFLYGWLDERDDAKSGIVWRKSLDTTIDWSTRKPNYYKERNDA